MTTPDDALLSLARKFIKTSEGPKGERVLLSFHRWLANKRIPLSGLGPQDVERFVAVPFRRAVSARTAHNYKRQLIHYLVWLYDRDYLSFDPRDLGIRRKIALPPNALSFLRTLSPTLKQSTCHTYQSNLQHFHEWLADARLSLKRLTRSDMEHWLLAMQCWERLTPEQARLFRRSGLVRIHFGAESGSDEVLKSIDKKSDT
ncbi:MAG: hypothetical protein ACT4TC_00915, partial [Myxococcaceae bacterium]